MHLVWIRGAKCEDIGVQVSVASTTSGCLLDQVEVEDCEGEVRVRMHVECEALHHP